MIRKPFMIFALLLLVLPACEQKEPATAPPAPPAPAAQPAETPAAPTAEAPTGGGWQALPGADQLTYQIDLQEGEQVYQQVCATCHREGIAGAPGIENRELWQERLAKGMPTLIENSINGFQGNLGVMPPKGGAQSLTDQQVASAVAYMVEQVPQQ